MRVSARSASQRLILLGYCEVHIEQGPLLELNHSAVGVVPAIAGQTRGQLTFTEQAGHAGATPMGMRSHHSKEYASRADLEVAVRVMIDFLERLAKRRGDG